jgi:integrase
MTKLTEGRVRAAVPKKGIAQTRINDSGGLSLLIRAKDRKWWSFRATAGKFHYEYGLGPAVGVEAVPLEDARERAAEIRKAIKAGRTPREIKKAFWTAAGKARPGEQTFKDAALRFYEDHAKTWRSPVHRQQFLNTLETYAFPVIGPKAPAAVTTADVLAIIRPLWNDKHETAVRVLQRIRKVLAADKAESGDHDRFNVATLTGHLDAILPPRKKVRPKVEHHAAVPHAEVKALMTELAERDGLAALALRLLILTATRTSEVLAAHWSEIDLDQRLWTIPAARTKTDTVLRVPLADAAIAVLDQAAKYRRDDAVFPGGRVEGDIGIMSNMAMLALLQRLAKPRKPGGWTLDIPSTSHGFRASFRSWCADAAKAPELAESALNHAEKFVPGYQRSDYLDRRRMLMSEWADYVAPMAPAGNVTKLSDRKRT